MIVYRATRIARAAYLCYAMKYAVLKRTLSRRYLISRGNYRGTRNAHIAGRANHLR